MSREFKILLSLLRQYLTRENPLPEIGEYSVNWPHLLQIANHHRVSPLLYGILKSDESVPTDVKQQLQRLFYGLTAKNTRSMFELTRVCAQLEKADILSIPFKGFVFLDQLYGDIGLRPCADMDIYIEPGQVRPAVGQLQQLGYSSHLLRDVPDVDVVTKFYTLELSNPHNGFLFDLHWEVTDGYVSHLYSRQELQSATRPFEFAGFTVPVFRDDITLALIVLHGAKGSWSYLSAMLDLAVFFRRFPRIDYDSVVKRMEHRGVLRMMTVGAAIVEHFFHAPVPLSIKDHIDGKAKSLAMDIVNRMRSNPPAQPPTRWRKVTFNLQLRNRWTEKMRYLLFKTKPKKVDMRGGNAIAWWNRLERILRRGQ